MVTTTTTIIPGRRVYFCDSAKELIDFLKYNNFRDFNFRHLPDVTYRHVYLLESDGIKGYVATVC